MPSSQDHDTSSCVKKGFLWRGDILSSSLLSANEYDFEKLLLSNTFGNFPLNGILNQVYTNIELPNVIVNEIYSYFFSFLSWKLLMAETRNDGNDVDDMDDIILQHSQKNKNEDVKNVMTESDYAKFLSPMLDDYFHYQEELFSSQKIKFVPYLCNFLIIILLDIIILIDNKDYYIIEIIFLFLLLFLKFGLVFSSIYSYNQNTRMINQTFDELLLNSSNDNTAMTKYYFFLALKKNLQMQIEIILQWQEYFWFEIVLYRYYKSIENKFKTFDSESRQTAINVNQGIVYSIRIVLAYLISTQFIPTVLICVFMFALSDSDDEDEETSHIGIVIMALVMQVFIICFSVLDGIIRVMKVKQSNYNANEATANSNGHNYQYDKRNNQTDDDDANTRRKNEGQCKEICDANFMFLIVISFVVYVPIAVLALIL